MTQQTELEEKELTPVTKRPYKKRAKKKKKLVRNHYTVAQIQVMEEFLAGNNEVSPWLAKQILKTPAFKVPGQPRRSAVSVVKKLNNLLRAASKEIKGEISEEQEEELKSPGKSITFRGIIVDDAFEITIIGNMNDLKRLF